MLNPEQVREKKRHLAVVWEPHYKLTEDTPFLCDTCASNDTCDLAFDLYNEGTEGFCLAEK